METSQEFIRYMFELTGYIRYEIDVVKKLCEKECRVLEAGRLKGRLETLESMLAHMDGIIEKYFETHAND